MKNNRLLAQLRKTPPRESGCSCSEISQSSTTEKIQAAFGKYFHRAAVRAAIEPARNC
jgi:hypothetical protein